MMVFIHRRKMDPVTTGTDSREIHIPHIGSKMIKSISNTTKQLRMVYLEKSRIFLVSVFIQKFKY